MPKITPFLWFDGDAEEAMNLYVSVFPNSRIVDVARQDGVVFSGTFELDGQRFMALNGGPKFKFTEALSLFVSCKDQAEVDRYWDRLTADGGQESMCGWLKDKFGVSWQIIPDALGQMFGDKDREAAGRAVQAMLKMKKIDVAGLRTAFEGKGS